MTTTTAPTLYEKYGGIPTITTIVRDFYARLTARPHLAAYFRKTALNDLIEHQIHFIAYVMDGPSSHYPDDYLASKHASHGITREHYMEVVTLLRQTLEDAGMTPDDVAELIARVARLSGTIATA